MKNYENYELDTELATVDFTLDENADILDCCYIDENGLDVLCTEWAKLIADENRLNILLTEWAD